MNYVEQLKKQISTVTNDRNKYVTKYQKYKQLYFASLNSTQNMYLNYIFTLENYSINLKKFECELNTLEFFYNIYFSPFNIDSWFRKNHEFMIKRTLNEILESYDYVDFIEEKSFVLGYLQYLRNLIMYHLKSGTCITIYSVHLDEPYIAVITKDVVQIINRFHNETFIEIGETKLDIFNINKHILLQFLFNPFWETSLYMHYEFDSYKIIKKNSEIINVPYELFIDARNPEWMDTFMEDYVNPYFDRLNIDFDSFQNTFYDLILNYDIDIEIIHSLWSLLQEIRNKLCGSDKVVFYNQYNDYETDKKQIKWMQAPPQIQSYTELTTGKRNLFTSDEIALVSSKKIIAVSPSDLCLILPSIFENNVKLLDVMACFLTNKKELPQDHIRRDIIVNQFKNLSKNLYLSNYGLEFLLYLLNRSSEENDYNILSSYIWDERLWKLNYIMVRISYINFFDVINNNTSLDWKDINILLSLQVSIESKIACIIYSYHFGLFYPYSVYYWENNPKLMLQMIKRKNPKKIFFDTSILLESKQLQIGITKKEINMSDIYSGYLFNSSDISKINLNKCTYLSYKSDHSIVELQNILSHFFSNIKKIQEISFFEDDSFTFINIVVNEFIKKDIFSLIIRHSRLIVPTSLEFTLLINEQYVQFRMNKYYYERTDNNQNFIHIKIDKKNIEYIKYLIYTLATK